MPFHFVRRPPSPDPMLSTRRLNVQTDRLHLPGRLRSSSNASTSSTLSVVSPTTSSANSSSSDLPLRSTNHNAPSPVASSSRTTSSSNDRSDYVLAMHDYSPSQSNATCLEFLAGQIIRVLNHDPSGWWDGELDGRRGWFPSNYVTDVVVECDEDEERQQQQSSVDETIVHHRPSHRVTASSVSATSWASAPVNGAKLRRTQSPMSTESTSPTESDHYCHPLMVPLLHGLSLLQSAVRSNRISHFQPSTACIVSCIRSLLSATECLTREAPSLQQFPQLALERKRLLSILATLVAQSKKASEFSGKNQDHLAEIDIMLKLGGQLFAAVRRFLAIALQCGLELPERRFIADSHESTDTNFSSSPILHETDPDALYRPHTPSRRSNVPNQVYRTPCSNLKARSMVNLRTPRVSSPDRSPAFSPKITNSLQSNSISASSTHYHKPGMPSISSTVSSSSASSSSAASSEHDEPPAPPPPFPRGPTSAVKVMEALKHTHDHYLSTIAAFIGHAHSHSRSSHASSTGHMYDLVREIVEMVCRLLTIVDAVMRHPDVPPMKLEKLKAAKEGLYNVTSSLAESVRLLTVSAQAGEVIDDAMSEEKERQALLSSATGALKAGADCVFAVKTCLNRSVGEKPFIITMAEVGQQQQHQTSHKSHIYGHKRSSTEATPTARLRRASSMAGVKSPRMDEEDVTIQPQSASAAGGQTMLLRESSSSSDQSLTSSKSKTSEDIIPMTPEDMFPVGLGLGIAVSDTRHHPQESDLISLVSPTDDGTTWEGSTGEVAPTPQQLDNDKIFNGQLPPIPLEPGFIRDPGAWMLSHDYAMEDIAYNSEGHIVGATLQVLVEKMTPHDVVVDPAFQAVFFLTFRLFATPLELVDVIISRYTISAPQGLSLEDEQVWQRCKGVPVRLRVSNFIRLWLEQHWRHSTDEPAIAHLMHFIHGLHGLAEMFPGPAQRITDLLELRARVGDSTCASPKTDSRLRPGGDAGMAINPPSHSVPNGEIPRPTMTKTLLTALRSRSFNTIAITDFDALELARQLTIMECKLYCAILPEEVLQTGQQSSSPSGAESVMKTSASVKAMSSLSTVITGWVAESILNEHDIKKRTLLTKFFIKVADRCTSLRNYSTSRSILAALDSSTISRLHQTWAALPQKNRVQLESLRRLADHSRNYHEYRTVLRNTAPPAVPFLGLYLTDVTFCREGNPSFRASPMNADKKLINFNKYHKLARIVQDMQRFQVPYQLKAIPEVQEYLKAAFLNSSGHGDLQDLYRRSLLVEPKQPADAPPTSDVGGKLWTWGKSQQQQAQTTQAVQTPSSNGSAVDTLQML